jgi:hypothetical protein
VQDTEKLTMEWARICKLCSFFFLILVVCSHLGEIYAIVVPMDSVRNASYYEYGCDVDRKLDWQIIQALETDGCSFHSGLWINGRVEMRFVGDMEALNKQIDELRKCPAKRVSVCIKPLKQGGVRGIDCAQLYWEIHHHPRKGVFEFSIDASSTTLRPDDIPVRAPDRPQMDQ